MTKADLVNCIYKNLDITKKESAIIVDELFEIIKQTLESGEKVKISGFGNFVVRQKETRKGRNPHTGDELEIAARKVVTFKPSQILKRALND
ncbi:MAG: integration host factor subunit alpha [Deltaproteobacteria bacterium]|nr:integration host factor subunit alpha [Candidatus Zymogenaceae bacterium]